MSRRRTRSVWAPARALTTAAVALLAVAAPVGCRDATAPAPLSAALEGTWAGAGDGVSLRLTVRDSTSSEPGWREGGFTQAWIVYEGELTDSRGGVAVAVTDGRTARESDHQSPSHLIAFHLVRLRAATAVYDYTYAGTLRNRNTLVGWLRRWRMSDTSLMAAYVELDSTELVLLRQ